MKLLLLICAVVMGQSVLAADKKPLTKEASAKVVEAAIRARINKPTSELTKADLEKVTRLYLSRSQLTSVNGLEKLTNLDFLYLGNIGLKLPEGLEKLVQLDELDLWKNQLTDVKGLEKLTKLERLNLRDNKLTDVKGLEKLTKLTHLNLHKNRLTDLKGLEKLTKLENLYLSNNPDITSAQITELQKAFPKCLIYSNPTK